MPTLATLTVNDGAATPVAHNFTPNGPDAKGVQHFSDRSSGIAIGFPTISVHLRQPVGVQGTRNRIFRAHARVAVPVLEQASSTGGNGFVPAPTLAYTLTANVELLIPERSTLQNRKDLLAFVKNALATTAVSSVVHDLEPMY